MNTRSLLSVRFAIFACCLGLLLLAGGRAENWSQWEVQLSPGRVGHSFSLLGPYGASALHLGLSVDYGSATRLRLTSDWDESLTLIDETVGDRLDWTSSMGTNLRTGLWHWPEDEMGQTFSSANQFFLIGEDRMNHGFLLGGPNGAFSIGRVLTSPVIGNANIAGGRRRELIASFNPGTSFWMIDVATHQRSVTNAFDLALTNWTTYTGAMPVLGTTLYLDASEAGRTFTLHSQALGGPEQLQSFVPEMFNAPPGSWETGYVDWEGIIHTTDHTGAEISIGPGSWAHLSIGLGMKFWLTRDVDGASTTVQTAENFGAPQWTFFGAFPFLPPPTVRVDVQVPLPAESWMVYYSSNVESGTFATGLTVDGTTTLYSYDDYGNVNAALRACSGLWVCK